MAYAASRSTANRFPVRGNGAVAIAAVLVPPNADRDASFHVQFFQNMLHVLLHSARAAPKNFPDLGVALAGRDPFYHFNLAFG
jgi:hypothetical protein